MGRRSRYDDGSKGCEMAFGLRVFGSCAAKGSMGNVNDRLSRLASVMLRLNAFTEALPVSENGGGCRVMRLEPGVELWCASGETFSCSEELALRFEKE